MLKRYYGTSATLAIKVFKLTTEFLTKISTYILCAWCNPESTVLTGPSNVNCWLCNAAIQSCTQTTRKCELMRSPMPSKIANGKAVEIKAGFLGPRISSQLQDDNSITRKSSPCPILQTTCSQVEFEDGIVGKYVVKQVSVINAWQSTGSRHRHGGLLKTWHHGR